MRLPSSIDFSHDSWFFTHDSADKLLTAGSKTYTYDAAGRTKTVTTGGSVTTLNYDYESRLTSISYPSGATNTFTYNGLDTRVSKADSSGSSTYMRDGVGVTDSVLTDGSATYTSGLSQRRSGATTYDLSDRLGSATKQTSSAQAVTATRTYDAFGLLVASTGTPTGPFGFAGGHGYQEDKDSGLKLLGHRYYDPSTGSFLNRDPVKDGRNWYGYCASNPVCRVDSAGLDPFWDGFLRYRGHEAVAEILGILGGLPIVTKTPLLMIAMGPAVSAGSYANDWIDEHTPQAPPWTGKVGDGA